MVGQMASPFDLSQILTLVGDLLVSCSLLGPPFSKITHANGYHGAWPGWAVSVSVLPLTNTMIRQRRNKGYGYLKTA